MKKIIGGLGSVIGLGGSKKKAADPAKPAEVKGPIQTPLTDANMPANLRRRLGRALQAAPTKRLGGGILGSERLGG